MATTKCPRMLEDTGGSDVFKLPDIQKPDDGTCGYCGSLLGDIFMARIEKGDVKIIPTDKDYKCYVLNDGGEPFKTCYRTDGDRTGDQSKWVWEFRDNSQWKFYFQHWTPKQMMHFIELLNAKKVKFAEPGHFYRKPYFIAKEKK